MIIPEIVPVRNGKMTKYLRKFKKTNRLIRKAYTTLNLHINLHMVYAGDMPVCNGWTKLPEMVYLKHEIEVYSSTFSKYNRQFSSTYYKKNYKTQIIIWYSVWNILWKTLYSKKQSSSTFIKKSFFQVHF